MAQGRRKDLTRAEPRSFSIDSASGIAATTTVWAWKVAAQRTFKLERCVLNVGTTITADASNFWTFALKDGSTTLASWTTQTAQTPAQGTLTANTPVEMILNSTDANLAAAGGDTLTLVATKTGTPSALPTFNVHPEGQMY